MTQIKTEYKGETIYFVESNEKWYWNDVDNLSLAKVKVAIDRAAKTQFKDVKALARRYNDSFFVVTVTSKSDGENKFWVKSEGGREKVDATRLFAHNDKNLSILGKINQLNETIEKTRQSVKDLSATFEPFTIETK